MTLKILYHGTGAHRRQSLEEKGIVPRLGPGDPGVIYATNSPLIASIFATARAVKEGCKGLVLKFEAGEGWEEDSHFPDSFKRKERVRPEEILGYLVVDPSPELLNLVNDFGIEIE